MCASLTHAQSPPITGIEESPQSPRSPCATSLSPLHRCRPHLPPYRLPAAAAPCWGPRRSTSGWISRVIGDICLGTNPTPPHTTPPLSPMAGR
ncbi:hypothetical protein BDA96_04G145100 [Sorghum bicolor]|uniref:Uncharacterized protein n=1 Tax=Sorghum bicolor TaxID=4558 RepID=A0A921R521_SORBI|nr:hypothetical protein BDA96_04G145100 [Sorghum bicolor]